MRVQDLHAAKISYRSLNRLKISGFQERLINYEQLRLFRDEIFPTEVLLVIFTQTSFAGFNPLPTERWLLLLLTHIMTYVQKCMNMNEKVDHLEHKENL